MTPLLTTFAIIYGSGVVIVAVISIIGWSHERAMQRSYPEEDHAPFIRQAARDFVRAPLWPIDTLMMLGRLMVHAITMLGRILTDAKAREDNNA